MSLGSIFVANSRLAGKEKRIASLTTGQTYRLNPSFNCGIIFKLLAVLGLKYEFIIELGKGDPWVAIEFGRIGRKVARRPGIVGARGRHCELWTKEYREREA